MKNPRARIIALNGSRGLDIYLDVSGRRQYLTTRRSGGLLYLWLKDGRTIGELYRTKPGNTRADHKIHHYAQYLVKLTDNYIKYDMAA